MSRLPADDEQQLREWTDSGEMVHANIMQLWHEITALRAELAESRQQLREVVAGHAKLTDELRAELAECKQMRDKLASWNDELTVELAECKAKLAEIIEDNRRLANLCMHLPEET